MREAKRLPLVEGRKPNKERNTKSMRTTHKVLKTQWSQAQGLSIVEELRDMKKKLYKSKRNEEEDWFSKTK